MRYTKYVILKGKQTNKKKKQGLNSFYTSYEEFLVFKLFKLLKFASQCLLLKIPDGNSNHRSLCEIIFVFVFVFFNSSNVIGRKEKTTVP